MSDPNHLKKWPETPETPETIIWIPGVPETVFFITTLNKIPIKRKEIETDSILGDFFYVNIEWEIIVREDSKILEWHFPWQQIVLWVVLVKLYETITWKKVTLWGTTISFDGMIIPWHSITVKEDWLYQKETKILSISKNFQIPFEINNQKDKVIWPKNSIEIDPNLFLLQVDPIRLAKSCELECYSKETPSIWDKIKWEINPKILDDNDNVDGHFLTEWAAQVLSSWISYILNWWETKEQKWEKFEFLTFKSLSTKQLSDIKKDQWPFKVEAELINVEKREITWIYKIFDKSGKVVQEWTISWTTMKKSLLWKAHKSINNNLKKHKLSDKINNVLRYTHHWLNIFFGYNQENWTLITKRDSMSLYFFKLLYSEIYDINISLFPNFPHKIESNLYMKINEWDIIEVKSDWLYKNWKPVFWIIHNLIRLFQNNKLSSIFTINSNTWEINLQIPLDKENTYNGEHIWDLLSELQNILLSWKKNVTNKTHFINNLYKPQERLFFDSEWIYTSDITPKNREKRYFFEEITQNHIILNKND